MPLACVLDSIEAVSDELKPLYKEADGKFVLDLDDSLKSHPGTKPLQNALETIKTERNELKAKLAEAEPKLKELPPDFDAAKWAEFKIGFEKDKEKKDRDVADLKAMYETRVQSLEQQHGAALAEKDSTIASLNTELDNLVVSTQLTDLLVHANVGHDYLEASKLLIQRRVKVEKTDGGERKVMIETNIGDQPLKDYVKAWADSEGKPFLAKPGPIDTRGGLGSRIGPDNPFSATHWNKTKQQAVPLEKREELARAAGFKSYDAAIMSPRPMAKAS